MDAIVLRVVISKQMMAFPMSFFRYTTASLREKIEEERSTKSLTLNYEHQHLFNEKFTSNFVK